VSAVAKAWGLALLVVAGCDRAPAPARPDLVLVTIDTLRADRLGLYGSGAATSPFLDSLAGEAVVFENAVATCPATAPAVASILTGLHRASHGVARNGSVMPGDVETLAEILHDAGYRTAGLVANPSLDGALGFGQGFETFGMPPDLPRDGPDRFAGPALVGAARALLDAPGDEPVFLWLHFMDPHGAYFAPEAVRARFDPGDYARPGDRELRLADANHGLGLVPRYQRVTGQSLGAVVAPRLLRARYDAEIAYADEHVAAVAALLQRLGRWQDLVLVVGADHGESLGEHDLWFQHGWFAYEDSLRVPLLVRAPGRLPGGRRVAATVSAIDLAPTLLELLGVAAPASMEGRSLLPVIRGEEGDRPAFAQTYYGNRQTSVRLGATKYVYTPAPPPPDRDDRKRDGWLAHWPTAASEELYDLAADPGELRNLAAHDAATSRAMRGRVEAWLEAQSARQRGASRVPGDLDLEEMLRSLGYAE
jgi:arylsulfatase